MTALLNKTNNLYYLSLTVPYFISVLIFKYEPSWDETFQIEAAIRLAKVGSYDASWNFPSVWGLNSYSYLNAWPPGYSILLSIFIFCGFKPYFISKILRLVLILLSYKIWQKNVDNVLTNISIKIIVKMVLLSFLIISSNYNTELILLFLFGYLWSYVYNFSKRQDNYHFFLKIGFISSLLFLFKYTGLGYIISIFFLLFYQSYLFRIKNILIKYALFFLPIVITIFTVFFLNHNYANDIITMNYIPSFSNIYNFKSVSFSIYIKTVFFDSIQIPLIIYKILVYKFENFGTYFVYIYYFLIVTMITLYFYKKYNYGDKNTNKLLKLTLFVILVFSFFMFLYSLFFFTDLNSWYPLIEYRYYLPLSPLIVILIFYFIEKLLQDLEFPKYFNIVIISLLCFLVNLYTLKKYKNAIDSNYEIKKINNFIFDLKNKTKSKNIMLLTDLTFFTLIERNHNMNVYLFPSLSIINHVQLQKKNTLVVIICSNFNYQRFNHNVINKDHSIIYFAHKNNFKHFILSDRTDIYWSYTDKSTILNLN